MAFPMPLLAPVTIATLSLSLFCMVPSFVSFNVLGFCHGSYITWARTTLSLSSIPKPGRSGTRGDDSIVSEGLADHSALGVIPPFVEPLFTGSTLCDTPVEGTDWRQLRS
jgi:hypothetical protein